MGKVLKLMLDDAIFLATCFTNLEKEMHCKLQNTCYTLQSRAATCNGFKKSLQSLQEVELSSIVCVPQCNFLFNLCCNGVARKVAGSLQGVTFPLSNLSRDFFRLATIAQSRAPLYLLQRLQAICFEYP